MPMFVFDFDELHLYLPHKGVFFPENCVLQVGDAVLHSFT